MVGTYATTMPVMDCAGPHEYAFPRDHKARLNTESQLTKSGSDLVNVATLMQLSNIRLSTRTAEELGRTQLPAAPEIQTSQAPQRWPALCTYPSMCVLHTFPAHTHPLQTSVIKVKTLGYSLFRTFHKKKSSNEASKYSFINSSFKYVVFIVQFLFQPQLLFEKTQAK